jgi:hypothetical protein
VTLHQQGTILNLYSQSFPVVLDLEVTDDGHLSGFVNFNSGVRLDGFPLGTKFSIITDDPRAGIRFSRNMASPCKEGKRDL